MPSVVNPAMPIDGMETGAEKLQRLKTERSTFDGELVEVTLDNHPEGGIAIPQERYDYIEEAYGEVNADTLLESHIEHQYPEDVRGAHRWVIMSEGNQNVAVRRVELAHRLTMRDIDNTVTALSEATGIATEKVRRDMRRLDEYTESVEYADGEVIVHAPHALWAIYRAASERCLSEAEFHDIEVEFPTGG